MTTDNRQQLAINKNWTKKKKTVIDRNYMVTTTTKDNTKHTNSRIQQTVPEC